MLLAADYPLLDIIWTMLVFFGWVIWFWLLITVFGDLFSRHDISGWGKAGWVVLVVLLPYLGVFIYLIAQGAHMAERREQRSRAARSEFDDYVKNVAAPGGQINFLWMMAANREDVDRLFGVVNVQPEFAAGGSGLDKGKK